MSEDKTQQIIDDLLKEYPIFEQLEFNEFTMDDKSRSNSLLAMKYRDLAIVEKNIYERMELLMEKVRGERYHYYKFEMDEQLQKTEIEQYYLPADEKIIKLKKLMLNQKVRVDFFESAYKAISSQQWNIKNILENQRMS